MNAFGWLFLILAWTSITVLVAFCFKKVFTTPDATAVHPEKTQGPGSAPGA